MTRTSINEKIVLIFLIAMFLVLAMPNLYFPGLSIDEAADGLVSSFIFKNLPKGLKVSVEPSVYSTAIFNRIFPIMTGEYHGSVNSYIIFPFLRLFGFNVFSLRFASIFISVASIFLIYYLCKMWFNRRTAFIAAILIVTNLLFVQYSRLALYREEIFIIFFFWATLFFLAKYFEQKTMAFLYIGCYLFGLGISNKVTFLWYVCGMFMAYVILKRKLGLSIFLNIKQKIIAFSSFCLGLLFIILYNISVPGVSIRILVQSLFLYPVVKKNTAINNLDYLVNFKIRISHLIMFLREDIAERFDWGIVRASHIEHLSSIIMILTLISFVFVLIFTLFSRNSPRKYRVLFFYIVYITIVFLTPFTVSGFDPGHLMVLFPFPQIVMALFLDYTWQWARYPKIFLITIYSVFLIPVFLFNIWMNIHFRDEMKRNGGYKRWSTAVYGLAAYLDNKNIRPVTFGWGLKENIAFLTDKRVVPIQYDGSDISREELIRQYQQLSLKKEPIFYLTMMSEENAAYLNLFLNLAMEDNRKKVLEKVFFNQAGDQVYRLYRIY